MLDSTDVFERLRVQRQAWTRDFAREVNLYQARRKLDAAWHDKNYAKIVELLEPICEELTSIELKKLDYAKKQIE
jgi:hypothetical protein